MRVKQLSEGTERSYAIVLDPGEEVMDRLLAFARDFEVDAARLTALGAFSDAVLGFFDLDAKDYHRTRIDEQAEVLSLVGDIARKDGEPKLHVHAVLGRRDASAVGGHLLEAHVRPTLEIVAVVSPAHLRREIDEATGLPLLVP